VTWTGPLPDLTWTNTPHGDADPDIDAHVDPHGDLDPTATAKRHEHGDPKCLHCFRAESGRAGQYRCQRRDYAFLYSNVLARR
jgi:hypothetical protein